MYLIFNSSFNIGFYKSLLTKQFKASQDLKKKKKKSNFNQELIEKEKTG